MQTTDSRNLFQSSASLSKQDARQRKLVRAAKVGDPIELGSKVVRMVVRGQEAYTAESGWVARRVDLRTGKTQKIYKAHGGPCTCLAFYDLDQSPTACRAVQSSSAAAAAATPERDNAIGRSVLFTGSWDKTIRAWDPDSARLISTTEAHSDFLKSLLCIPQLDVLISGSSDKTIHVWDIRPLLLLSTTAAATTTSTPPLQKLATIRRHTRPIESLVLDDSSIESLPCGGVEATFFSADSMGVVCRWVISRIEDGEDRVEVKEVAELRGHKTSVADMVVAEGGLWTASVDTTVLFHPFSTIPTIPIPIPHPYYVKSLLLLPPTFHPTPLLLTGSTDESIRVWDVADVLEGAAEASTGARHGVDDVPAQGISSMVSDAVPSSLSSSLPTAKEMKPVQGHCHEVSALCTWIKDVDDQGGKKEAWVVSAGLDGTIRRWSMQDILNPQELPEDVDMDDEDEEEGEGVGMTEEEEKELEALMDD